MIIIMNIMVMWIMMMTIIHIVKLTSQPTSSTRAVTTVYVRRRCVAGSVQGRGAISAAPADSARAPVGTANIAQQMALIFE